MMMMNGPKYRVCYEMVPSECERSTPLSHNLLVLPGDLITGDRSVVQVGTDIADVGHLQVLEGVVGGQVVGLSQHHGLGPDLARSEPGSWPNIKR